MNWTDALSKAKLEQMRQAVNELNSFFDSSKNVDVVKELFASGLVEPLPISFHEFQARLKLHFSDYVLELLLNSVAYYSLDLLDELGASDVTINTIGYLARQYSSKLKMAAVSYQIVPLSNWFRIVTEIVLREENKIHLKHSILKYDGTRIEYSGDIPSSFQMVDHIVRQIDRACTVLGIEAVLGSVNLVRMRDLLERFEELVQAREEIKKDIESLGKGEDDTVSEEEEK